MAEIYEDPRTRIRYRIIGRLPAETGWESYVGRSREAQRDVILHFRRVLITSMEEKIPPNPPLPKGGSFKYNVPVIERYRAQEPVKQGSGKRHSTPAIYDLERADFTGPTLDYEGAGE